ncbi:MAG: hypothetical protein KAX87_04480 [Nitrospira sp.]|jgi:hypothetical protein|nr:hypothetical protein [Nitrospira sp.]
MSIAKSCFSTAGPNPKPIHDHTSFHQIFDTLPEHTKSLVKRRVDFGVRSDRFGRIWRTPMQLRWFPGEQGTTFTSGLIAHRNHEIKGLIRKPSR